MPSERTAASPSRRKTDRESVEYALMLLGKRSDSRRAVRPSIPVGARTEDCYWADERGAPAHSEEKQMTEKDEIKTIRCALDQLGLALTGHDHVWSPELRAAFEKADRLLRTMEQAA